MISVRRTSLTSLLLSSLFALLTIAAPVLAQGMSEGAPLDTVTTTAPGGPGSMAEALVYAMNTSSKVVKFRIPTSDPGFDGQVFTIDTSGLSTIDKYVAIDGATQTAYSGDTNPGGPEIRLRDLPISGGTVTLKDAEFDWSGSSLTGRLDLVSGTVANWYHGTLNGILNIERDARMNLFPTANLSPKYLRGTINNDGSVKQLSTTQDQRFNAVLLSTPSEGKSIINNSGQWHIEANASIEYVSSLTDTEFNNSGWLFCNGGLLPDGSHGTGSLVISADFYNTGLVKLESGYLRMVRLTQNAGSLELTGGNIGADILINGGGVGGVGEIDGNLVNSNGLVRPGSLLPDLAGIGTLAITGNFTQENGGRLSVDIRGTPDSKLYGVLAVGKEAILDGSFEVQLPFPVDVADDSRYKMVKSASRSGTFLSLFSPPLSNNRRFRPAYVENDVDLIVQLHADNIPPVATITSPPNGSLLQRIGGVSGTVQRDSRDAEGHYDYYGVDRVEFVLKRNSDGKYWTGNAWGARKVFSTNLAGLKWYRNSNMPAGASTPYGTYTLGVAAYDKVGNVSNTYSTFTVDSTLPNGVTIDTPTDGTTIQKLDAITGTATDAESGIARVEIAISRSNARYWTGRAWRSGHTQLKTTLNGSQWQKSDGLPEGANLPGGIYNITAIAYDKAGNLTSKQTSFAIVRVPASLSITTPRKNSSISGLSTIAGRVNPTDASPLKRVEFVLRRDRDGLYWTGSNWGARTLLPATVTGERWQFAGVLPSGALLADGSYVIAAAAYDIDGRVWSANSVFTVDATFPAMLTVETPANGSSVSALPTISGFVADNAGGTGIARLEIVLRRNGDGQYWTGTAWGKRTLLATTITGTTWQRDSGLPNSELTNGAYTISAFAYDFAGNLKSASSTFSVLAPQATGSGPAISPLGLSSATLCGDSVVLIFTGPLDPRSTTEPGRYTVAVNGRVCAPESIALVNASTVVIQLPQGTLRFGDAITVSYALRDSRSRPIEGKTSLTAN